MLKLPMLIFKPDSQEDFVTLSKGGTDALAIPSWVPFFSIDIYDGTGLPTPKIFKWRTLVSGIKPEKMFGG